MAVCPDADLIAAFARGRLSTETRARVLEHLDGCDECLELVAEVARGAEASATTLPAPSAHDDETGLTPGTRVGKYTLLEFLGQGAMGTVFSAHDAPLDRRVALKLLRPDRVVDARTRDRLFVEARAMAKVKHANVVTVYDAGEAAGTVYIAMELVDGGTLRSWLADGSRGGTQVIEAFVSAARGLSAAHAAGVIHRDFKPDNVLVETSGRVAVSDFGLATGRSESDALGDTDRLSLDVPLALARTGAVVGTPAYMAPEQFAAGPVDARADQFSFAVSLYEALYGERPFAGSSLPELQVAVRAGTIRPFTGARPQTPRAVERILARALRADPAERFTDMLAIATALERSLRRPQHARVAAIALAVAAVAATGVALLRPPVVAPAPSVGSAAGSPSASAVARPPAKPGSRATALVMPIANPAGIPDVDGAIELIVAETIHRSRRLDGSFGAQLEALASELGVGVGDAGLAAKLSEREGTTAWVVLTNVEPVEGGFALRATLLRAGEDTPVVEPRETATSASKLPAAAVRLARSLRVAMGDAADEVEGDDAFLDAPLVAVHECAIGVTRNAVGDSQGAVAHLRRALAIDDALTPARAALGLALSNATATFEAAAEFEKALHSGDRLGERRKLQLRGHYYGAVGRWVESIGAYQLLLSRWPGDAGAEQALVATAIDAAQWPLAVELSRRAASARPRDATARANLLLALLGAGDVGAAARESEGMLRDLDRPSRYGGAFAGLALGLDGRRDAALDSYARLELVDREFADENRADLALYEGRLDDARALLQRWVDDAVHRGAPGDARTELVSLSLLSWRRGDRKAALSFAERAAFRIENGNGIMSYLIALVMSEAGAPARALALSRTWGASPSVRLRGYGKLIEADAARSRGASQDALALYRDALQIEDTWMARARFGTALLVAGETREAERQLAAVVERRAEGSVFASPSRVLLPPLYLALAHAKEALHDAGAADAYRRIVTLGEHAQNDPITDEARARLAAFAAANAAGR